MQRPCQQQEEPWPPSEVSGGECGARGDEVGARTRSYRYNDPVIAFPLTLKSVPIWIII